MNDTGRSLVQGWSVSVDVEATSWNPSAWCKPAHEKGNGVLCVQRLVGWLTTKQSLSGF